MKQKFIKRTTLFIVLSITLNVAFGQDADSAGNISSVTGKVYCMRSTGFQGFATAFTFFIDDSIVCKLNNERYSIHEVTPGIHKFSSQFGGKKSKEKAERIEIDVEAGKTYYIELIFQPGVLINNLYCQEVTENSAKGILAHLKQDTKCF